MDPTLAQIYGTNQSADATDLEKLAADELAAGLAEDGGINVNDLSQDQIEAMAQEVLNDISGADGKDEEAENTDADDETLAKVAEADRLGRIMAHAMNQELVSIQKEASAAEQLKAEKAGLLGKRSKDVRGVGRQARDTAGRAGRAVSSKASEVGGKVMSALKQHGGKAMSAAKGVAAKHPKAALGLGAAGVAAGAFGAGRMSKKSSALDTLARAHVLEILQASGIDPDTLQLQQEKVSEADPATALSNAVESRAWEILAQYGVTPSTED